MGWNTIIPSVTGTDALGLYFRQEAAKKGQTSGAMATAPAPSAAPTRIDASALRFTPSAERSAVNFRRFVDQRRRGTDPRAVASLEAVLADPQFTAKLSQELAKYGLVYDNLADAFAVWWMQSWQTLNGDLSDPSRAASQAVKAQAARALLASPTFAQAGDAEKQALAEELFLQAAILGASLEQVKADPAQMRRLGQSVRMSAGQAGLDLDAMVLTEAGFAPRGG
jgi:hypothetical protein